MARIVTMLAEIPISKLFSRSKASWSFSIRFDLKIVTVTQRDLGSAIVRHGISIGNMDAMSSQKAALLKYARNTRFGSTMGAPVLSLIAVLKRIMMSA